jgi:hypothetical protein
MNGSSHGLSYQTSLEARAYMHLRRPENPQGIALLKRPGIVKTDDFLDCIDRDIPKGKVSVAVIFADALNHILMLRSISYI